MLSVVTLLRESKMYLVKPYIKVGWHEPSGTIVHCWNGFATFEEILEVGKRTLSAVQQQHATKVLYDTRAMEVLDDRSRDYISGSFTIQMIRAGIHYSATVMPEDPFAQHSIQVIKERMERHLPERVKYFKTFNKAVDWLSGLSITPNPRVKEPHHLRDAAVPPAL